jgi:Transposase, Mutator family
VVRDLLASLRERGLETTRPILWVIDGAKALRRAIGDVFDHPIVQRCQLHKLRNVTDRLPDAVASTVAKRMRRAYHHTDALVAQAELEALARELDHSHPGAAASLREGLAETLTIGRLACTDLGPDAAVHELGRVDDRDLPRSCRQRPSAGGTGRWCWAGWPPGWARPPSSSDGSTATCTCRPAGHPRRRCHTDQGGCRRLIPPGRHRTSTAVGSVPREREVIARRS